MGNKIKCIIIDDEFPARILLKEFIEKVPTLELVGNFKSGLEALQTIQNDEVDLMFLDIQMPDITGVNFLKMLTKKPLVVFTTAYSEYAIESYQLDVLDYLLKPFSFDRFMQAVGKAMSRVSQMQQINVSNIAAPSSNDISDEENNVGAEGGSTIDGDYLLVKADHKIHRLRHDSIVYIEGLREYITIHCNNGEKIIVLESLKNLEETLPEVKFMRVHKSFIVRRDMIRSLYGNQIAVEGVKDYIPVGKSYVDVVKKMFAVK